MEDQTAERRLYRSCTDRMISGVCGGIAEYFNIDSTVIRLAAVVLLVIGNIATLILYVILALVVPETPIDANAISAPPGDETGPGASAPPPPGAAGSERPAAAWQTSGATYATPAAPSAENAPRRRSGLGFGIALIVIGVIALAAVVLPGVAFWQLWPLIIILAGLIQAVTPGSEGWSVHRFFDGLTTVTVGLVFLGITTGAISWTAWWSVLSLWPLLLIAIGLDVLGKGLHAGWLRVIGSLLVIGGLLFGAFVLPASGGLQWPVTFGGPTESFENSAPAGGVQEASLSLDVGAGDIVVASAKEPGLVTVSGEAPGGAPTIDVQLNGAQTAAVMLSYGDENSSFAFPGGPNTQLDVGLDPDVFWSSVEVKTGASSCDVDLSGVRTRQVVVESGVSSAKLRLGLPSTAPTSTTGAIVSESTAVVKSSISDVSIEVPRDAPVRLELQSGLTAVDVSDDFEDLGLRIYETADYGDSGERWIVRVESGIGSVKVRTY